MNAMDIKALEDLIDTHGPVDDNERIEHWWDRESVYAVIAAAAAKRPLLIFGETGLGKSQIAAAAAAAMGRNFLRVVVHPQFEAQDLLWSFDYTKRLGDSQVKKDISDEKEYLCPGPLWYAMDPVSASQHKSRHHYTPPPGYNEFKADDIAKQGSVLLIDEIDKADGGVANSLLETLGERSFRVPHLAMPVQHSGENPAPLIVFTSNGDRELPAPFVRRCTVLHLEMPNKIEEHFLRIGKQRFSELSTKVLRSAAKQIITDRANGQEGESRTGLAEYLDLLHAVNELTQDCTDADERADQQMQWMEKLSTYFLKQQQLKPR